MTELVYVPVVATERMTKIAVGVANVTQHTAGLIWEYMIAAAPTQPAQPSDSRTEFSDAEMDAARYQFLRSKVCIVGAEFHILNLPKPTYIAPRPWIELDQAIDSAIKASMQAQEEK